MIECSLDSGQVIGLLRSRRGRGLSDEIAGAVLAEQKARWAAEHASSAAPAAKWRSTLPRTLKGIFPCSPIGSR